MPPNAGVSVDRWASRVQRRKGLGASAEYPAFLYADKRLGGCGVESSRSLMDQHEGFAEDHFAAAVGLGDGLGLSREARGEDGVF